MKHENLVNRHSVKAIVLRSELHLPFILLCLIAFSVGVFDILRRLFLIEEVSAAPIQVTTLLGLIFCLLHAAVRSGVAAAVRILVLTLSITLGMELIGVLTGLLFGSYEYTGRLGELFLELVPYIVPPAWFMMLYPSYLIAIRILVPDVHGPERSAGMIAALGALVMTTWDLIIDPVMVAGGYWVWEQQDYFGVPFSNYLGWWCVSFVILYVLDTRYGRAFRAEQMDTLDRLALAFYGIVGLGSAVAALGIGLEVPALLGLCAMSCWIVLGWRSSAGRKSLTERAV